LFELFPEAEVTVIDITENMLEKLKTRDFAGRVKTICGDFFEVPFGSDFDAVKSEMQQIAGEKYHVLDRFEQQADTFKIMQIEKIIAYLFLTFILVVACFNIIGSLSMLIIDKKDDVVTLRNLGATDKQISRVFLFEGRLISLIGAVIGILLGLLLCWLQQRYGLVSMGSSSGTFVVNAYPVSVHYSDVLVVFLTVVAVGWLAVWYPVRYLSRRLLG
jgi:lipoprotein-releasing system permease protein